MSILVGFAKNNITGAILLLLATAIAYIVFWISPRFRVFMLSSSNIDRLIANYNTILGQCKSMSGCLANTQPKCEKPDKDNITFDASTDVELCFIRNKHDGSFAKWYVSYFDEVLHKWMPTKLICNSPSLSEDDLKILKSHITGKKKGSGRLCYDPTRLSD